MNRIKDPVHATCKVTGSTILCSCHRTPMNFEKEQVDEVMQKTGKGPYCDVCRMTDKTWTEVTVEIMEEWDKQIKARELSRNLMERLSLPPFPHIPAVVAKSVQVIIDDFNTNGKKYYDSICEDKLRLAQEVLTGNPGNPNVNQKYGQG